MYKSDCTAVDSDWNPGDKKQVKGVCICVCVCVWSEKAEEGIKEGKPIIPYYSIRLNLCDPSQILASLFLAFSFLNSLIP